MVGSDGSKQAVGMMALHDALRTVCLTSEWIYSVFWTIRPRPRLRGGGGSGSKVGDDYSSLMLMWEDGFCKCRVADCFDGEEEEDPVRKAFSKMSIQLYNYGEGLMGKVASDKCHKWLFKDPIESQPNITNYWHNSFDGLPSEWTEQFDIGIQTIAVIQAGHGLLQLGSCKIIPEDLHFVLRMRQIFESLDYQSGFYLSQLFSSTRNAPSSSAGPSFSVQMPSSALNWGRTPENYHHPGGGSIGIPLCVDGIYHPRDVMIGSGFFNLSAAGRNDESARVPIYPGGAAPGSRHESIFDPCTGSGMYNDVMGNFLD